MRRISLLAAAVVAAGLFLSAPAWSAEPIQVAAHHEKEEKKANPCAANPCNPCAAKEANPCDAKKANPCNPCAAKKANPCSK